MIVWMLLHLSLATFPVEVNTVHPMCQLEVLPPFVIEDRVLLDFHRRVDQYVRLHRRLERSLPPEHLFADLEDMSGAVDALHEALVDARPNARAGAVFTPAVANVLSRALERAIAYNGYAPAEVLAAIDIGQRRPKLEINDRFPGVYDFLVWPAFRAVLPQLPEELQYRFVGRDLILVDTHADLVVDILSNALPAAELPTRQPALY